MVSARVMVPQSWVAVAAARDARVDVVQALRAE